MSKIDKKTYSEANACQIGSILVMAFLLCACHGVPFVLYAPHSIVHWTVKMGQKRKRLSMTTFLLCFILPLDAHMQTNAMVSHLLLLLLLQQQVVAARKEPGADRRETETNKARPSRPPRLLHSRRKERTKQGNHDAQRPRTRQGRWWRRWWWWWRR